MTAGQGGRGRRWLHGVGLLEGPDASPPAVDAPVERFTLASRHANSDVEWAMYAPPAAEAVVVCLHGRGASYRFAFDVIAVHRFVAAADLPWAVVR